MEVKGDASSLLLRAYKNGKWSDVTIMNGDKKYQVHKLILSDVIPYFDRMFSSGLSESTSQLIELDHPPHVFDLIIEWAYCSKILITKENAVDLFHLADYMNIPKLTALCLEFLWNESSDSPFIDVGHWINQIATEELLKSIDRYICSNFWDIVHTDSFLDYDVDTVAYMISLDDLDIDEIKVLDAIIRWIEKSDERRSHLPKLLKKVHWVDINGFQFMKRIDKFSWILKCDQARHEFMAAVELSYFKSLKTIQVNDFNFGPRSKPESCHYALYRKNDSYLEILHFDKKSASIFSDFSENLFLSPADFGDSHITEHCMDSDVVIRIDWNNKTYRLFKDSDRYCYCLLFGRLFRFDKKDKKIHFWKGERLIEFVRLTDDNAPSHETLTKYKGGLCLSTIETALRTNAPTSGSNNHQYYEFSQISSQNHSEYKSRLTIKKCTFRKNKFKVVASHEIVTKEPIKMLKSTIFHDLLVIFVDCTLIVTYDFNKNTFRVYKNSPTEHMCCLYFHSTGSELWIFYNESESGYDKTIIKVFRVEDGKLIPVPVSHNPLGFKVTGFKMIGLISLEAKH
ncbi:uncharacterized protein LOC107367851 [Tetranychus urticae]|uniref:BTB domain-containing protein n=1 Tax=Tetranychus urticae TaxID=32264 RepID=T1KWA0_TETUR|nr:uncharacterized protein LOC107367851 [Tetranychus urticae]